MRWKSELTLLYTLLMLKVEKCVHLETSDGANLENLMFSLILYEQ